MAMRTWLIPTSKVFLSLFICGVGVYSLLAGPTRPKSVVTESTPAKKATTGTTLFKVSGKSITADITRITPAEIHLSNKTSVPLPDLDFIRFKPLENPRNVKVMTLLTYAAYKGTWKTFPDFGELKPLLSGVAKDFRIDNRKDLGKKYGVSFKGRMRITRAANYTFTLRGSGLVRLLINGEEVVTNSGAKDQNEEETGKTELSVGTHPVEVQYLSPTNNKSLWISVMYQRRQNSQRTLITALKLFEYKPKRVPTSPFRITLHNGDQLTGVLEGWKENKLQVKVGKKYTFALNIPVKYIAEIQPDSSRGRLYLDRNGGAEKTGDRALVRREDSVHTIVGMCMGIEKYILSFNYNDEDRKIALERLQGILLEPRVDVKSLAVDDLFHTWTLVNGDRLSAAWKQLDKKHYKVKTLWGESVKIPISIVAQVQTRNGRLHYLSDFDPVKVEETPFFDRVMPYRRDQAFNGEPLKISGRIYRKGLAMHSRCVLHYDLNDRFEKFRSKVGLQDPEGYQGRVVIRLMGDGKTLFEDKDVKGVDAVRDVNVSVIGINRLTLEVDYGHNQDVADRVIWGNARLVKAAIN